MSYAQKSFYFNGSEHNFLPYIPNSTGYEMFYTIPSHDGAVRILSTYIDRARTVISPTDFTLASTANLSEPSQMILRKLSVKKVRFCIFFYKKNSL